MKVRVSFYSYFKDLTGATQVEEELPSGSTVQRLLEQLYRRFPQLSQMSKSMLIAVGVEYQPREFVLTEGDEVSLFPPVQGG